jgi:hypothetical protein
MPASDPRVDLDLNDPDFQAQLFALDRDLQRAVLETLRKIRSLTWSEVYRDQGLKWEKIASIVPPKGAPAVYSLRITRSCRATAYRQGNVMRLLAVYPDHDATYGRK